MRNIESRKREGELRPEEQELTDRLRTLSKEDFDKLASQEVREALGIQPWQERTYQQVAQERMPQMQERKPEEELPHTEEDAIFARGQREQEEDEKARQLYQARKKAGEAFRE